jgi:hypothetical protein
LLANLGYNAEDTIERYLGGALTVSWRIIGKPGQRRESRRAARDAGAP